MNCRAIFYTLGCVLNVEAICMLLPLICTFIYQDNMFLTFLACILICASIGIALIIKKPKSKTIYAKEGLLIVALSWITISIFGALPFVFSGFIPNFIDAFFETVSGFTTTGASILADVEALPKSLIFWRSFTHWIGGMGVLVFLVALLPLSGGSNMYLIRAESPGPSVSKLVPKVRSTAMILYGVYILLSVIEVILLLFGKLSLFEALTLTFGTAGTGGFGILNSSIADYSPYIQTVIGIFMMIFGIDFSVYYLLLLRKFSDAFRSEEVKAYLGIVATSTLLITINIFSIFGSIKESLRHAFFQVASVITTTGYATFDFEIWPSFSKTILVMLMFVGACAGSTGGGIKVSRILIYLKCIVKEIKVSLHPNTIYKIKMNNRTIEHEVIRSTNVFMTAYLMLFAISLLIISLDNFDFTTNFTATLATMNNIGPGLNKVGPTQNFSIYSNLSKVMLSINMLVGRLEIFPMLVLISPHTWKK
ncbi:MAG: TrkH family potassium uptake protein [Clostridia bacterium]|nr:TrkH family potassium uptake protein [Clostridia bacterium]